MKQTRRRDFLKRQLPARRDEPNAPVEVGYAHSVASIMCFKAWESGRRQVFDPAARQIRPA